VFKVIHFKVYNAWNYEKKVAVMVVRCVQFLNMSAEEELKRASALACLGWVVRPNGPSCWVGPFGLVS
jgi:hypothetical protein